MAARPPEGPKADYSADQASEAYIPRPPSPGALDQLSKEQGMLTDEWTGEPPAKGPSEGDPAEEKPSKA
ncbi:hypothetical protein [Roseomonas chloroacetimidivorans]|jgi:hypothetical protein|uniref:hypothetical protein n=1 Tax=Roseomonas chloroacetimidivorans TaxID=1766656 RepID=UPI003C78AD13